MADSTTNNWKERELGALWVKKNDRGEFFTGYVKNAKGDKVDIVIYPNRFLSENPNGPAYRVYKGVKRDAEAAKPAPKPAPKKAAPVEADPSVEF